MFENLQGNNHMGFNTSLDNYKKIYSTNMKMSPTTLRLKKIKFKGYILAPDDTVHLIYKDQAVTQEVLVLNVGICLGVFYADDSMIGAWDPEWLQNVLKIIIGIFWRYGIVENFAKSRTMTCQPRALPL